MTGIDDRRGLIQALSRRAALGGVAPGEDEIQTEIQADRQAGSNGGRRSSRLPISQQPSVSGESSS